jgi:ribosomal protein S18 acetylase RimI-like enzyme
VLGVDAAARGTGVGRALMEAAMDRVHRDRVGTYLEVSEGGPVALYERYGFAPLRRLAPPSGAPVMHTMWRPAYGPPPASAARFMPSATRSM